MHLVKNWLKNFATALFKCYINWLYYNKLKLRSKSKAMFLNLFYDIAYLLLALWLGKSRGLLHSLPRNIPSIWVLCDRQIVIVSSAIQFGFPAFQSNSFQVLLSRSSKTMCSVDLVLFVWQLVFSKSRKNNQPFLIHFYFSQSALQMLSLIFS